jgi:DNA-binding response OmpR family regulator
VTAAPQPLPPEPLSADDRVSSSKIVVALDDVRKRIEIENIASISGATEFRIISELVKIFREDRNSDRAPKNFRTMTDHALADALSANEDLVRKTISRIRKKIKTEYQKLHQEVLDLDHIVQNVHGKGYRLNPLNVHIVDPSEMAGK